MAHFAISLNQSNPTLASSFAGTPLSQGKASGTVVARAPEEARQTVAERSQYAAGMTAEDAQAVRHELDDILSGRGKHG